ncbi:MAG: hypothetical protein Q9159_000188 [Coniocarpon cinnabarinum]
METFTTLKTPLTSRTDFQEACKSLLRPLVPFFSSLNTRVRIGATGTRFDESGAQLEGWARPVWGLAALLAGGAKFDEASHWIEGLKHGTNPESPEFWGYCRDVDQRMVEMCPIGFALAVNGDVFWKKLSEKERENVGVWLRSINEKQMPNTNWLWFRVFANLALMRNSAQYSQSRLDADLDHLDTFYRGDGWSNDGPEGYTQMDSYSGSYAIQYLQLLYAGLNPSDTARREKYFDRARTFALDAVLFYDPEGRHITFGRSLTYRFAMAGFWSAVAFAGLELPAPLSWGVVKGLLLRNCRWWMSQKDMLTPQGTLSIGYSYPNQFISENYNSPGSPYWFMLSFAALACPEDHPFWTAKEESLPETSLPSVKALKQPSQILIRKGGHTFLLSSGQMCHYPARGGAAKYGKFAYSSAFGYSVPTGSYTLESIGGDNVLALSDDYDPKSFGETWKVRRVATEPRIEILEGMPVLVSGWEPWHDVSVDTWLIPPSDETPNWHIRIHRLKTGRALRTAEGAWALEGTRTVDGRELDTFKATGEFAKEGRLHSAQGAVAASAASGAVGISELTSVKREGKVLDADANGNLLHSRSVLPTLLSDVKAGETAWYATAVYAVPESVPGWEKAWKGGWEKRPGLPSWVEKLIAGSG